MTAQAFQALAAYKATQQLDERPSTVLARAHEELARVLGAAISAYEGKRLDEMCRHNARAVQIISTLMAALAPKSPDIERLRGMYARTRRGVNGLLWDPEALGIVRDAQAWAREMSANFRKENNG